MSKSYRKPWGTFCSIKNSAHQDKTVASRAVRRAQEQSLREAIRDDDWEGWLIPECYECSSNEVWGWRRDGRQRPMSVSSQYNNPYAYVCSPTWMSDEQIIERWEDSKRRDDEFMKYIVRK